MSTDTDLKHLWQQQEITPAPNVHALLENALQLKKKIRNKLIFVNTLMALTIAYIVLIFCSFEPKLLTTKIGTLTVVLAIVSYLVASNSLFPLTLKKISGHNSKDFLQTLVRIKQKQEFLYRTMISIYFVLLSTGVTLYMIEYTLQMSFYAGALSYLLFAAWIAFSWFYLRPKTIKKQLTPLIDLIKQLKMVREQL